MKQLLLTFLVAGSLAACQSYANPKKGVEGHTCDAACMAQHPVSDSTNNTNMMALKDHLCTDDCKEGIHVYVHGEKGHTCTEACKNQ